MVLAGFEDLLFYMQNNGVDEGKEGGNVAATAAALYIATLKDRCETLCISSIWN